VAGFAVTLRERTDAYPIDGLQNEFGPVGWLLKDDGVIARGEP
jgi:hypothetical protein